MGLLAWWQSRRLQRRIHRMGRECRFLGRYLEIKGKVTLGDRCVLGENVVLRTNKQGAIVLGDDVEIGDNVIIQCNLEFSVGEGSVLREFCVIRDTHHVVYGTDLHWRLSPHNTAQITIGPNCYVGAHSYLGPGVQLGEGAVIAPGSMVTRSVGAWEMWGGRPARLIANRKTGELHARLRQQLDFISMFGAPESAEETTASSAPGAGD